MKSIIWITGLSGAGKSTLAKHLVDLLRARGETVVFLDGDELREVFGATVASEANHGREARLALAMQYAKLCRVLSSQGLTVVIATISLFREIHEWNRTNLPGYFEVYLQVPLEELRRRDPKKIYRRFDAGELKYVAGLDLPVDLPESPDMIIEFDSVQSVSEVATRVLNSIN